MISDRRSHNLPEPVTLYPRSGLPLLPHQNATNPRCTCDARLRRSGAARVGRGHQAPGGVQPGQPGLQCPRGRDGQPGNYHVKALVVDGFVAFVGSPNATNNSCVNGELAFKVSGKAVAKDTYDTAWAEAMRVETY